MIFYGLERMKGMDRKERIDSLRRLYEEQRKNISKRREVPVREFEIHWKRNFMIKTLISVGMLAIVYLLFQLQVPYAKIGQEFIRETMQREYNFQGVYQWYEEKFAGNPAIIPTFSVKQKQTEMITTIAPISRKTNIESTNQGILIETVEQEPIMVIANGIIKAIGHNESLGNTVIVKHSNGFESIYGMLESIDVEKDEWVEAGHIVGMGNKKVYIAIKNQTEYLNPLDVIPFDTNEN